MSILTPDDGVIPKTPEETSIYQAGGWQQCYGNRRLRIPKSQGGGNRPCDFHISPQAQQHITDKGGYYTCPRCFESHDLMHDTPWHGSQNREDFEGESGGFSAGGGTRIGLPMQEQAQIGEDLVQTLGESGNGLPGYGPITWVHPGGAIAQSPLDMATDEWGIEVKTLGYDAIHHRFIPGDDHEKAAKNTMAQAKNLRGVLGILVILNYRTSKADIFAREFPYPGKGVGTFRSGLAQHLIAEVPFKNPFMQPDHPAPVSATPAASPAAPTGDFLGVDDEIPF